MIDDENLEDRLVMLFLVSVIRDEFTDLSELGRKKRSARLEAVKDGINDSMVEICANLEMRCRLLNVLTSEDMDAYENFGVCLKSFNSHLPSRIASRQKSEASSAPEGSPAGGAIFRVFTFQNCDTCLWKLRDDLIAALEKYCLEQPKYEPIIFCFNVDHLRQLLIQAFLKRENEELRTHAYDLVAKKIEKFRTYTSKKSAKVVALGTKSFTAIKQPDMHKFQAPSRAPKLFGTYWNCENSLRKLSLDIKRVNFKWVVAD